VLDSGKSPRIGSDTLNLRLMTFNIRHGVGIDRVLDLRRQALIIGQADIALLQEVDQRSLRSRWQDQTRRLADDSGLIYHVFGASLNLAGGRYGNAILSRFPLRNEVVHRIPRQFWAEPRTVLQAETTIGGEVVHLFNTHLGHTFRQRREGIQVMLGLVQRVKGMVLLGGDLNVTSGSAATAALGAALQEASQNCGPTYPASQPREQIDHLFVRDVAGIESCQVIETQVSDHCPILAVIKC
jgi:endonuclease/exonuclease/phosphatase family metal-dependent hydrolase